MKMTLKIGLLLALTLGATAPAHALSCRPYDPTMAFNDAQRADEKYVVVLGDLSFAKKDLPVVDLKHQKDVRPNNFFTGTVTGKSLGQKGFINPFTTKIKINAKCFGPWCADLYKGTNLMFLKKTDQGYLLETDPCQGQAFPEPSQDTLDELIQCMRKGRCETGLPRPW
jgi:hypothetical protein